MTKKSIILKTVFKDKVPVISEMYNYEYRTEPHDNKIPYDGKRKDG